MPNLGTSGRKYDLVLGAQKPGPYGTRFINTANGVTTDFVSPLRVPGAVQEPRPPFNPLAPFVVASAPGEQIDLTALGIVQHQIFAPSPLTQVTAVNLTGAVNIENEPIDLVVHIATAH